MRLTEGYAMCGDVVQAWRARALHYFLVNMCGLQSGTPSTVLQKAHEREIPKVFQVEPTTSTALHYVPELSEYNALHSAGTFAGSLIKLSPLMVLLCMPVQLALLLFGALLLRPMLLLIQLPLPVGHVQEARIHDRCTRPHCNRYDMAVIALHTLRYKYTERLGMVHLIAV